MQKMVATLEYKLLVFGSVLFGLVVILFLGLALVILKLYLESFLKCLKKRSHPERRHSSSKQCQYLGQIPSNTQNLRQPKVPTIRLANHQQSSENPYPGRNRIPQNDPHVTPISEEYNQQTAAPPRRLMRQPSESTCPTEMSGTDQGCDNLALSTSTLHNQSLSSNRSMGSGESTCPTEMSGTDQGCDNLAFSTSTLQNQSLSSTSTVNTVLSSGNSINQANYMNNRF